MAPALKDFDLLPDDAIVPDPLAAQVLAISRWTLIRENPVPAVQVSERRRGQRVGDLRNLVRGKRPPTDTIK